MGLMKIFTSANKLSSERLERRIHEMRANLQNLEPGVKIKRVDIKDFSKWPQSKARFCHVSFETNEPHAVRSCFSFDLVENSKDSTQVELIWRIADKTMEAGNRLGFEEKFDIDFSQMFQNLLQELVFNNLEFETLGFDLSPLPHTHATSLFKLLESISGLPNTKEWMMIKVPTVEWSIKQHKQFPLIEKFLKFRLDTPDCLAVKWASKELLPAEYVANPIYTTFDMDCQIDECHLLELANKVQLLPNLEYKTYTVTAPIATDACENVAVGFKDQDGDWIRCEGISIKKRQTISFVPFVQNRNLTADNLAEAEDDENSEKFRMVNAVQSSEIGPSPYLMTVNIRNTRSDT